MVLKLEALELTIVMTKTETLIYLYICYLFALFMLNIFLRTNAREALQKKVFLTLIMLIIYQKGK